MVHYDRKHDEAPLEALVDLVRGGRVVVLGGAGCSTESGIPDYRGPEGSLKRRSPIQYLEFVRSESARARYWARSTIGWLRIGRAVPNVGHRSLVRLEEAGTVIGVITQNVDGLHQQAGSRRVVELHGSLAWVCCLTCGARTGRDNYQERLLEANPGWPASVEIGQDSASEAAPDGDAEISVALLDRFRVPPCVDCGGILKPDVVFFGENVPAVRVEEAWRLFERADVLLVVGSSLTVYSGRRFVYRAQKDGVPIGVVNLGPTRADEVAAVKVDGWLGSVLPRLADALVSDASPTAFQGR